jgi:hypothetical protein
MSRILTRSSRALRVYELSHDKHLLRYHNIDGEGHLRSSSPVEQRTIGDNAFTLVSVAKKSEFQRLLIRWLVYCHICLAMVENEYFRESITYLNKGLASLFCSSDNPQMDHACIPRREREDQRRDRDIHQQHSRLFRYVDIAELSRNAFSVCALLGQR